jgi:hypothetical protein
MVTLPQKPSVAKFIIRNLPFEIAKAIENY